MHCIFSLDVFYAQKYKFQVEDHLTQVGICTAAHHAS